MIPDTGTSTGLVRGAVSPPSAYAAQPSKLSLQQQRAAVLLATGLVPATVAAEVQSSSATLSKWSKIPEFALLVEQLSRDVQERTLQKSTISLVEMQDRINQEALGALERVVEISVMAENEAVKLNANLQILDRATNAPRSKMDAADSGPARIILEMPYVEGLIQAAREIKAGHLLYAAAQEMPNLLEAPIEAEWSECDETFESTPIPFPTQDDEETASFCVPTLDYLLEKGEQGGES